MDSERWNLALNPQMDEVLCQSPRHSSDSSNLVTQGTDLFVHRSGTSITHFYLRHWSTKQNEIGILQIVSEDTAREFIVECTEITELERNRILELFTDIF